MRIDAPLLHHVSADRLQHDLLHVQLEQMQPHIAAASCIVPTRNRDLAVVAPTKLQVAVNQPFDYIVDASSVGTFDALNGFLSVQVPEPLLLQIVSATMPGGTCTTGAGTGNVRCELGDVPAGQSRRLTLRLQSLITGDFVLNSTVTSTRDVNSANENASTTLHITNERVVQLSIAPQPLTVTVGEPFELSYDVSAVGTLPLRDMRLHIDADHLTPLSASMNGGSCTLDATHGMVFCQLGDIAIGTPQRLRVQWVADTAGEQPGQAEAFETANRNTSASHRFTVQVQAARDVGISTSDVSKRVAIGQDATYSLQIASSGQNSVDDVHIQLTTSSGVTLTVDAPIAASCTSAGGLTDCALGAMPAQSTLTLQLRARADFVMDTFIHARVVLPTADDAPVNDEVSMELHVRLGVDLVMFANDPSPSLDERLANLTAQVLSVGANAAENVQLSVTLPVGFAAQSAMLADQPCTVDSVDRNLVSCTLARVAANFSMQFQLLYVAPQPGTGTIHFEVSCDDDADTANNSRSVTVQVLPSVDAGLTATPPPERARADLPTDLVFTVSTGKYSVPDVHLNFMWFSAVPQFSASAPGTTCDITANGFSCEWISLPANSSVPVSVRLQSHVRSTVALSAQVQSAADVDHSNNHAFVTFPIIVPGDVAVTLTPPAITLTSGQTSTVAAINIDSLSPLEGPLVELTFDPTRLQFSGIAHGFCFGGSSPQSVFCQLDSMSLPGRRPLSPRFTPQGGPGVVPVTVRVSAFNDFDPGNDEQTLMVTIVDPPAPPAPPPAPPPSSGGGGGGGGSMSWLLSALLLAMWHHRRLREHRQRFTCSDRPSHRRHLRAVPSLLRPAPLQQGAGPAVRRRHRRAQHRAGDDRARRHSHRRRDRSRHRVVPQRSVARLQDRRRHRARAVGAVSSARGSAGRDGRGRVADGRARSRRCARLRRGARRGGRARAEGLHLDAGQGSRAMRARRSRRADGSQGQGDPQRGGVREKFGVDPALIPDYLALVGDTADGYPGIDGHRPRRRGAARHPSRSDREFSADCARRASRAGTAVQETRDAAHRCAAVLQHG